MEKMEDMENRNKNQETVKTVKTDKTDSAFFSESLKSLKSLMQIFVESAKSAKSAKPIYATSATSASANFVGTASCESTVRYRERSRITSCYLRYGLDSILSRFSLASLICVLMLTLGVGEIWGATGSYSLSGTQFGNSNVDNYSTSVTNLTGSGSSTWTVTGYGVDATNHTLTIGKGGANYLQTPNCPDNITSVVVTWSGNTSYYLALQTTAGVELEAKSNPSTATEATFTVSGNYTQLRLVGRRSSGTSNAAAIITSVTVNYGSAEPHTVRFYKTDGTYTDLTEGSAGAGVTPPVMSTPCNGWAFQGWSKSQSTSPTSTTVLTKETLTAEKYYPSSNTTLYPVYTKAGTVEDEVEDEITQSTSGLCTGGSGCSGGYASWSNKQETSDAVYAGNSNKAVSYIQIRSTSPSGIISTTSGGILKSVEVNWNNSTTDGRSITVFGKKSAYSEQADLYDNSKKGTSLGTIVKGTSTKLDDLEDDEYTYVGIKASDPIYINKITITWLVEVDVTYYYSYPTCCTALGYIKGSVSWSGGNTATLTWDKMSHVDATTPYTITCKVTGGSSAGSVGDVDLTGDKATCTITSLTAGTSYDFKIAVTAASNYCDKDSTMTSRAPKLTNAATALTGSDYAQGSGPGTAKSFTVTGTGLTGDITVTAPTNFEVSKSSGSGYANYVTYTPSAGELSSTVYVRLAAGKSTGTYGASAITISGGGAANNTNVTIAGTVSSPCSVPSIGNPTLTSIASGTITVSCPTISGGTNCDVDDYGFVWKASSAPTISDNKTQKGTNNQSTAFSDALSISFTTGVTYYIKAYAHNDAGNNLSSTALQVTPQSVTFNSNGGSDVATAYVNNGGTVSQPSNPTKTHYTFGGWYTDNGTWKSAVSFSSTITEDKTYYAKWNPVSYTITTSGLTNVAPASDFPTSFTYTGSTTTNLNRTLAVDGDNFFLPDALTVTMGGSTLTAGTDYTYSNSTGAFTFDVTITGNVVISGSAVAKLKSIAITTTPTKTVYFAGEAFSNTGAVVTATMGDETTKAVSGSAVWTPSGALTAEASKTMTATYTERGISKTATTTVDVYSVTVNKVNEDGDAISTDGVTATWTVGTKTLAAGVSTTNYVFWKWEFDGSNNGLTISSTTSANTTITGTPTGNVTIKAVFYKPVAVTWTVNGESYDEGSPTDYVKRGTQWKDLTLPDAPDDDAIEDCDVDKFMGWTNMAEHWVGVTHDEAPTVCLKSFSGVTTVINDPIEFKAVYAKEDVGDEGTFEITASDITTSSYNENETTFTKVATNDIGFKNIMYNTANSPESGWSAQKRMQFKGDATKYGHIYNKVAISGFSKIRIYDHSGSSNLTVYTGTSEKATTSTISWPGSATGSESISVGASKSVTSSYYDFSVSNNHTFFYLKNGTTVAYPLKIVIYYTPVEYSDYITLCSSTNITISDPSITGEGEITFDQESPVPTCLAAQTITVTVTPDAGYECTALSFTGGSVSVSPTISDVLPLTEETEFELSFAKDANGTLATSATFSPKAVTNWTWTYGEEAIPNPVNLYVGEKARFDVTYEPSDVITTKKTYTRTKVDAYINWVGDVYANYFYCSGKASTGESTTTVTVTHADGPTQNIYIKVKPLPTVTFVDNVHNLTDFTNWGTDGVVASTASSGVITHTKVTPSHDNIDEPGTGNTCEKQHLHLVGWIRSDYDKVADYMDGTSSDKPTESEILGAGADGEGLEYFFAPNASINIEAYNGLTFYAVWALVE